MNLLFFLLTAVSGVSQVPEPVQPNWTILEEVSYVSFSIKNMGTTVTGRFDSPYGIIYFNPSEPEKAFFDVKVDVRTIDTGIRKRDRHLLSADFFEADTYPYIYFTAESVQKKGKQYEVTGKMKLKYTTSRITIPFQFIDNGEQGLFSGNMTINRFDYGVGGNYFTMGEEVQIEIRVAVQRLTPKMSE